MSKLGALYDCIISISITIRFDLVFNFVIYGWLLGMKEQKMIHEGLNTESLSNGMFRVRLDNDGFLYSFYGALF